MTRSFAACAGLACAVCVIGRGGGTLEGAGVSSGPGGGQPPGGSGSGGGNGGGSAPTVDAGAPGGNDTDAVTSGPGDAAIVGGGYDSSAADPGTDGDGMRT